MAVERGTRSVKLACEVAPGLFSNERAVRISLPDGRHITALVHQDDVVVHEEIRRDRMVPGSLTVWCIADEGDTVVIDLPQPGFEGGPRLRVPRSLLK